ncbi:MAG TPA: fructokinase [Acidobacteriaceae bacterium]
MKNAGLRIGVDVGGTKIEALAITAEGAELLRYRVPTPRGDYDGTVGAVAGLVARLEQELDSRATVGVGIPGTIARETGLVKNANSTWLNGQAFDRDLSAAMARTVRCANDANCFAVSEASDGAAAGKHIVFGVIIGTGCGGGVAVGGRVHEGPNGVGGEWGHNPLPWQSAVEYPGPACYCGHHGCIENWISGTGFAQEYERVTGTAMNGEAIVAASERGEPAAVAAMERYENRLARSLASLVNVLDPDVIVLGGGMSKVQRIYANVPALMPRYVFGRSCHTPVLQAKHGDSSGVRGAAWLWPENREQGTGIRE